MRILSDRVQRTIGRPAQVEGTGYLTGRTIHLRFLPAPAQTGVVFVRTDLGAKPRLAANVGLVTGTNRRTTLGQGEASVNLVEHVLGALGGLRIDNCLIELDGPEPPGLDGSAHSFVLALTDAGIVAQAARKPIWGATAPVTVRHHDATLTLHPSNQVQLRASYRLDYGPSSPIVPQQCTIDVTPESFLQEIASCRTFLTQEEAIALQKEGLGTRTKINDLLVFGPRGPLENRLRFANEPARHKLLDLIGDLSLLGEDVSGHLVAYRSGHALNIELVRELRKHLAHTAVPTRAVA